MESIAVETLCEIFSHLDWRGLISAKLICRTWRNALTARHFWYLKITNLLSEPGAIRPEEPLADYTVSELESWVIKYLRAQEYWTAEQPNSRLFDKGLVIRESRSTDHEFSQHVLVPGGRWVLAHDENGLRSYDLEDHIIEKAVPTDPPISSHEFEHKTLMEFGEIWIDPSQTKLSLRLALRTVSQLNEDSSYTLAGVDIYQIGLLGHGQGAFLQARLVKKLQSECPIETALVAMTSDLLVERWKIMVDTGSKYHITDGLYLTRYMEIAESEYQEKRVRAQFMEREVDLDSHGHAIIRITPDNRIIRVGNGWIEIYDMPELHTIKPTTLSPLHRCIFGHLDSLYLFYSYFSQQFAFQNNMWLVYSYRSELRLTRFLENGDYALKTATLGSFNIDTRRENTLTLIGPSSSITLDGNNLVSIYHYSWDSSMKCTMFQHKHIHTLRLPETEYEVEILGVDESKGRIVLKVEEYASHDCRYTIIAVDLMG